MQLKLLTYSVNLRFCWGLNFLNAKSGSCNTPNSQGLVGGQTITQKPLNEKKKQEPFSSHFIMRLDFL